MTEFTSHPVGGPNWIDLMSPDVDASKAFYGSVFGWDLEDMHDDQGNRVYVMATIDGKNVAGIGGQAPGMGPMPAIWNTYIATDDIAATAAKVGDAGGTVMMPPMQVMQAGQMAVFIDPTGAAFSAWQAGEHIGAQVANDPNTWSWNELLTRDVDTASAFYSQVFGWTYDDQDMGPMGTYRVIEGGENGGWGGVMGMPEGMPDQVPNHWMVYFMVSDTDATTAAVTAAGGQVAQPSFDAPGVGRITIFHDPQGGSFSTLQPEPQG